MDDYPVKVHLGWSPLPHPDRPEDGQSWKWWESAQADDDDDDEGEGGQP